MPYADPEKRKAYHRKYHDEHRAEFKKYSAASCRRPHVRAKWNVYQLKYYYANKTRLRAARYGLTVEALEVLTQSQSGKCGICKRPQESFKRPLAIDHEHSSGRVRGLLCGNCNSGLGMFQDDVEMLMRAIDWLKK